MDRLPDLYLSGFSLTDISKKTGIPISTARRYILKAGICMRGNVEAIILAGKQGKMARGHKRIFTDEWKKNISIGKLKGADKWAKGFSKKPNGYIEITRGKNKGRCQHIILMEEKIGRKLYSFECVHHDDGDKSNNDIDNLILMTKRAHLQHHRKLDTHKRNRDINGRFL